MTSPIFLLTDFGSAGPYPGVMKGVILHNLPDATIVDLHHDIEPQRIDQASFLLDLVWDYLPRNAVVVAVVDPGVGGDRATVAISIDGRTLLAPNNGLASELASRHAVSRAIAMPHQQFDRDLPRQPGGDTFWGRDVFAPAAAAIAGGKSPTELGAAHELAREEFPTVKTTPGGIVAPVRYVDPFGNLMTGLERGALADTVGWVARIDDVELGEPVASYHGDGRRPLAVWNSWGRLEVADPGGNAQRLLGDRASAPVELRPRS